MFSLILKAVAFILFLIGGFNQTLFGQGELDLICFGLAAWILSELLAGYGPAAPTRE